VDTGHFFEIFENENQILFITSEGRGVYTNFWTLSCPEIAVSFSDVAVTFLKVAVTFSDVAVSFLKVAVGVSEVGVDKLKAAP